MKEIKLTKGYVALVDDADYDFLNQWKWCANGIKLNIYAKRAVRKKIVINGDNYFASTLISMHRVIMGVDEKNIFIDHIDGNGLNNQRSNLRCCTQIQNSRNRRFTGTKTSIYKGVHQKGIANQWRANINTVDGVLHLGTYATEKEAAVAYNIAAIKYFGEFANLNKIEESIIPVKIKTFKIPNKSSQYRGVSFHKKDKAWQAAIKVNNKAIYLGRFSNEVDAAICYNEAAIKYLGKDARLNNVGTEYSDKPRVKSSTSKQKGVSWYPNTKRWQARITANGKRKLLGYFKEEEEAILAIKNYI